MCSLDPLVTMMFPYGSTVPGWHALQLCSVMLAVCGASDGGISWQLPQYTSPCDVHTGSLAKWQYELAQVCIVRFHVRFALTTGSG